ncbi:MAG: hypothetical protein WC418_01785, partial [Candidatus Omnitrophota bacterium]
GNYRYFGDFSLQKVSDLSTRHENCLLYLYQKIYQKANELSHPEFLFRLEDERFSGKKQGRLTDELLIRMNYR